MTATTLSRTTAAARTVEERAAVGKAARDRVPLTALADCPEAPANVVGLVRAEDQDRVPDLLPIRYGRMLASPFTFYRGAASVMAADLATQPTSGLTAQLCGDAHLSNFGVFATPERRLVFDVNDFDETYPGPFEWDAKRLAASLALAGRDNGHDTKDRRATVVAAMRTYRTAMRTFAGQPNLKVWYASLDVDRALADLAPRTTSKMRRKGEKALEKARRRDSADAARKLTSEVGGELRFVHEPPLVVPLRELMPTADAEEVRTALVDILAGYRSTLPADRRHLLDQFHLADVARKVVGVGSVGTRAWVLLLLGRDPSDPLLLQVKEAGHSVLEPHCSPQSYASQGERVVSGQRLMQASSDIFLGWQEAHEEGAVRQYYVRQLRDGKLSAEVADMGPRRLTVYGQMCAWTLARAHARAGDRVAIASYLGKRETFEDALAAFAEAYADRTQAQHVRLQAAADDGELPVAYGI